MSANYRALLPKLSLFALLGVIFLGLGPASAGASDIPFVTSVADTANVLLGIDLALDSEGNPHMVYYNFSSNEVRYATRDAAVWTVETIWSGSGATGYKAGIVLDADGAPHVAFRGNGRLKYANRVSGTWSADEDVHSGAGLSIANNVSIALDSQGNPGIAYTFTGSMEVRFAKKSGTWTHQLVDSFGVSNGGQGNQLSLQFDGNDDPWISYHDPDLSNLNLARHTGGAWSIDIVDSDLAGTYSSMVLGSDGNPRISYAGGSPTHLRYAAGAFNDWDIQDVDVSISGGGSSLVLTGNGDPVISCSDSNPRAVVLARLVDGAWVTQTLDGVNRASLSSTGIGLDHYGNPSVAYAEIDNFNVLYTDSALDLLSPNGGETWAVGSLQDIQWYGGGAVDVYLSVDGGNSYDLLESGYSSGQGGGVLSLRVPHRPSRFARIRVERPDHFSVAESDSFLTIEASISMLMLAVQPAPGGGVILSWQTNPGPADLGGYKVERSSGGSTWDVVAPLIHETTYFDPSGSAGMRYRLSAINGLGEEFLLGETSLTPQAALSAWPLPYAGGELNVLFATFGGLGGGSGRAEVGIFDVNGRLVQTVARGEYGAGIQRASWDGRDTSGRSVPNGVYFLRALTGGESAQMRVVVLR